MAILEGLPTTHYNPELKAAALERAAVYIQGVKLAALAMRSYDANSGPYTHIDTPMDILQTLRATADTTVPVQCVLFPITPIQKLEVTKLSPFTFKKIHLNDGPMELSYLTLVGIKDESIYLLGRTPEYTGPSRHKECTRTSFEATIVNPEQHQLAFYTDTQR